VSPRQGIVAVLVLFVAWLFFRPRAVPCPQCRGEGAPPLFMGEASGWRGRICATCGASATPDLPLVGEPEPAVDD